MRKANNSYSIDVLEEEVTTVEEPQLALFDETEALARSLNNHSKIINKNNNSTCTASTKEPSNYNINALLNVERTLLSSYKDVLAENFALSKAVTFQLSKKLPVHGWFQYTQGFSPQVVDYYIEKWKAQPNDVFLDPFVGSGTSLLQCQLKGIKSYGWDISPLSIFLSKVKTTSVDLKKINKLLKSLCDSTKNYNTQQLSIPLELIEHFDKVFSKDILEQLSAFQNWFCEQQASDELNFILCAALSALEEVSHIRKHGSHYRFMNNDNVGVNKKLSFNNLNFFKSFNAKINNQILELPYIQSIPQANIIQADARDAKLKYNVKSNWIITSPPYLNRNNYIAQSKTEMFFGGLLKSFDDYRNLTKRTLRSHVEAERIVETNFENSFVNEITTLVSEMGESYKGVSQMINGYFEDMNTVLTNLISSTSKGTKLAFVVGCSRWSGVVVPTDLLIAQIAKETGYYDIEKIEVVRYKGNAPQQMARFGKYPVRESVVILKRN